jgi:predicted unusual protein kinase regulating ubiquinone biosynthesis (AarF/ABC1/UbiB family)
VTDLPRKAVVRTARLATLPLGVAGRATVGLGKRIGGKPAELVAAEIQARTADQIFRVLGELKGGAMKFGQALSIIEAALPEELAAPYRATLTKLQDSAPPMPAATTHRVLAQAFGRQWRRKFRSFDDKPAAAASIGQVHRAVWKDGREVAVKVQYPGAADALMADLGQISRMGRVFGSLVPGLDLKPLLAELRERVGEEVDYRLEAEAQRGFAEAFEGDPDFLIPSVVAQSDRAIVSDWIGGTPLSQVIASGTKEERDRAGLLLVRFFFSGPARAGLLHADPHPGNWRLMPDGRLGVLDYGLVARLPDGLPPSIGRLLHIAQSGEAEAVLDGLRAEGFVKPSTQIDAQALLDYLMPFVEPASAERFHFTRAWMRSQASRVGDPRSHGYSLGRKLNLPPSYLLIHRVWLGGVGVLCQLDAEGPFRAEMEQWLPGLAA